MVTGKTADKTVSVCVLCASIPLSHIHRNAYQLKSLATDSFTATLATQLPVEAPHPEHINNYKRTAEQGRQCKTKQRSLNLAGQHST